MLDDSGPPRPKKSVSQDLTAEFERLLGGVDTRRQASPASQPEAAPFAEADSPSDGTAAELPDLEVVLPAPEPYGDLLTSEEAGSDLPDLPPLPDLPDLPPLPGSSGPADLPDFDTGQPSASAPPPTLLDDVIGAIDDDYAARTSRPAPEAPAREPGLLREKVILFSIGAATFAVPARNVREMDRTPAVTPVPGVPRWLKGVANLRGDILSVVDLKGFFGADGDAEPRRMLVVSSGDREVVTALLVDSVSGMALFSAKVRQVPEALADERIRPYVDGLVEHDGALVTILDVDRILRAPDLAQFQGA